MFDGPCPVPAPPPFPALQQSQAFVRTLHAMGRAPLVLDDDAPLVILHRRMLGCPFAMLARARITDADHLADRLHGAGLHRRPVIVSPDAPCPELARIGAVPVLTPATAARVDLTPDTDIRRARLHQKWRNRLTHASRAGLRVSQTALPDDPGHWLWRAEAAQQAARGYRSWPRALTRAYARANPGHARLWSARIGKTPVAAMLFLRHGDGVSYHIGHTTPRGKQVSAHNLLLWQAMDWFAARDAQTLDLGLIDTAHAPGLARFKLGTGACAHRLGGTWLWWAPARGLMRPLARLDQHIMGAAPLDTGGAA